MKNSPNVPHKHLIMLCLIALAVITLGTGALIWLTHTGTIVNNPLDKKALYSAASEKAVASTYTALGDPLQAMGFTSISKKTSCYHGPESGESGNPLRCTGTWNAYHVFSDTTSKQSASAAAKIASKQLQQQGWKQGNYELGKWVSDVLGGVDYNPDASFSKDTETVLA